MTASDAEILAKYNGTRTFIKMKGIIDLHILEAALGGNTHTCLEFPFSLTREEKEYLIKYYEKNGYKIEIFKTCDRSYFSIGWDIECAESKI